MLNPCLNSSLHSSGLSFRARFERDETRQDWRAIPELAGLGQDYFFMVPLLGKIREIKSKRKRRLFKLLTSFLIHLKLPFFQSRCNYKISRFDDI